MNRRVRTQSQSQSQSQIRCSPPKRDEGYHKYLKPGALAQLRDSRINAKSHPPTRISLYPFDSSASPTTGLANSQIANVNGFPCFTRTIFTPRCPQRKKLVAAKSFYFITSSPSSPVSDSPDSLMDLFNNDLLVAH